MRHSKRKQRLNRFTSWRKATLSSLCRNLLIKQRIVTTLTKAKAASRLAERLIGKAKSGSLSAIREINRELCDHRLTSLLAKEIAPRFKKRNSGFTRIIPWKKRRGDNALMVILELTEQKEKVKKIKKPSKEEPKEQVKEKPKAPEKKPPIEKKPTKRFLGGLSKVFKKEKERE